MYLFWLFSSEQLRYLLPILPLLAIAIAASAEVITKDRKMLGKVLRCSLVAACVCAMLTTFAWFCQKAPLRVVLGARRAINTWHATSTTIRTTSRSTPKRRRIRGCG